jgi:nitroreductase
MDFFEAVTRRRSVRNYSAKPVPTEVIQRAIDAALIAPNSSNMQTWRVHWVKNAEKREALVKACMSQGAARTAQELLVFTCNPKNWKVSQPYLLESAKDSPRKDLKDYYSKLMPFVYGYRWLAPAKWLVIKITGLFRPIVREVVSQRDIQEVCVKSTALACQNFMLAIAAQGFDTCPMEGFDSLRVRRILGLPCTESVVMCISVGERTERGIWGERYRIPRGIVVREI